MGIMMTTQAVQSRGKNNVRNTRALAGATQRIGWRGVSLVAPEEWSLTSVSGEGPNGYLRVESPETLLIQVKWWERRGIVSVPDALDTYIRDLRKRGRKGETLRGLTRVAAAGIGIGRSAGDSPGRQDLEFRRGPRQLSGIRPAEQAPVTYTWTGEQRAYGVVWHCSHCKRLVIAEVVGRHEDDFSIAPSLLGSIREHGEGGYNPWGMYGLFVEVPFYYQLEKHQLMTGYMRLGFRHRSRTLAVQRWGLSDVVLKETNLKEWYDYQDRNALGRYRYRYEEAEVCGHPGLRLVGREKVLPGFFKAGNHLTSFSKPSLFVEGHVWECPETKKIYSITAQTGRRDETLAEVMKRFCCH